MEEKKMLEDKQYEDCFAKDKTRIETVLESISSVSATALRGTVGNIETDKGKDILEHLLESILFAINTAKNELGE